MPLTNAEKQKKYRERIKDNPEKKEEIRKKNLERIKTKIKKVKDITEKEKIEKRKIWRKQKQNQKEKKIADRKVDDTERQLKNTKVSVPLKKLNIRYKKSLRTISKLNKTVQALRKRIYRQKTRLNAEIERKDKEISKVNCRNEVLESMIKAIYKSGNFVNKRLIKNAALNDTQKHSIHSKKFVANCLGVVRIRKFKKVGLLKSESISKEITKFFVRDDISRITAGKKECRTRTKEKQQIRYLSDTLSNLYKIYIAEGGQQSFSTFFKYKPFFVLSPTIQSRDTCMCIKHSNMNYLLKALQSKALIDRSTALKDIILRITCDINSFTCMHDKCSNCINSTLKLDINEDRKNEEAKWWRWESEKHTYTKKEKQSGQDKEIHTRKTTKKAKTGTLSELIETFNADIKLFKKHYHTMKTQQKQYQECLSQLKSHEVLILCDFSENFNCKLSSEIQSMHFGASKQQISLHCIMVYWKENCQSFCTVSDSPCHEPAAIWAHLLPVLKFIREKTPEIKVLHIYSDGPTSQYRQKKNYYLLNLFSLKMKFNYATWSFTESGHGKGVADGIGGSVKRALDRQVLYGHDIRNADDAYTNISAAMKAVKPFLIPIQDIENMKTVIPNNLRPISGNNGVHQIITTKEENIVLHRSLSCFCGSEPGMCSCYFPKRHSLLPLTLNQPSTDYCGNEITVLDQDVLQDTSLQAASSLTKNDCVELSQNKVVTSELPVVIIEHPPPVYCGDGMTVRNQDTPEGLDTGEDIPVLAACSLTENEGVELLSQNVDASELPVIIIEPTPADYCVDKVTSSPLNETINLTPNATVSARTSKGFKRKGTDSALIPKRVKVLMPTSTPSSNENKMYSSKSLKTVVARFFICHLCKQRRFFTNIEKTVCMVCKNRVCRECSGQAYFDYICTKCLE